MFTWENSHWCEFHTRMTFLFCITYWLGHFISCYLKVCTLQYVDKIHVWFKNKNHKCYAWATHSSVLADRFHTEPGGCFAFTWYRCKISNRSEIIAPGTTTRVNSCWGDSRWHDISWCYHVNKCRAIRGNRSDIAPARKSPRCHLNTPLGFTGVAFLRVPGYRFSNWASRY